MFSLLLLWNNFIFKVKTSISKVKSAENYSNKSKQQPMYYLVLIW